MRMILRPFQAAVKAALYAEWTQRPRACLLACLPTGAGKCLARGTRVLLYDGATELVENIEVGDRLMGPDSKPRTVLSTCTGREEMYRVTPTKGEPYVVNASHILSLRRTPTDTNPRFKSEDRGGEIVNMNVVEFANQSKWFRHIHKGWRTGVDFKTKLHSAAVPAYFLGLWLGDGSSRHPSITTADPEMVAYVAEHAATLGLLVRDDAAGGKSRTYHINSGQKTGRGVSLNTVKTELSRLNVLQNKHIPYAYKTGDRAQRLDLLAGLIDSDGSLGNGGYDFISKYRVLADDIAYVARSLGLAAYVRPCMKSCNGGPKAEYFRVSISGNIDEIPCKLPHKQAASRRQKKSVLSTGISVEAIGEDDYFGFTIDGDHLFLLDDFTVTHNTVLFADIIYDEAGAVCVMAHRGELVSQISMALARDGVRHRIIGSSELARACRTLHLQELGVSYVDPNSRVAAASVDTLKGLDPTDPWFNSVSLVVGDEGHHVLRENKWGRACAMFPNARVLLVTATPCRADGKGLGRHADGLVDKMIVGPGMRELIGMGFLTEYRIFCPPSDLDLSAVPTTDSGEFSPKKLAAASRRSHITGDVVEHYLRIAPGKLGITFAIDIEDATTIAQKFRDAGVPAEVVSSKTLDVRRAQIMAEFKARKIMQLVNVDLFGEGFDLPAIEVVSMARPTQSYALYAQQFGRVLRLLPGKSFGIVIDHVGNVIRHGLPDKKREWSLDKRASGAKKPVDEDVIPLAHCVECTQPYEKIYDCCPHCGHAKPPPANRSAPEFVDGDLCELTADVLAKMRGDVRAADNPFVPIPYGASPIMAAGIEKKAWERREAQGRLRNTIALWAGWQQQHHGRSDTEIMRLFYMVYGTDILTAQTLKAVDADELRARLQTRLDSEGIV